MILIYGSELAACIGENKYRKPWQVLINVFKRINYGIYYAHALKRLEQLGVRMIDEEEMVQDTIQHSGISEVVTHLLETKVENSDNLNQTIIDFECQLSDKEQEFKQKKKELTQTLQNETYHLEQVLVEITELEKQKEILARECDLIETSIATADCKAVQQIQELESQIEKMDEQILIKEMEKESSKTITQQLQEETETHNQLWNNFKNAKKNIISQKLTSFGKEQEDLLIKNKLLGTVVSNNDQFYTLKLGHFSELEVDPTTILTDFEWGIGGRIDGIRDGVLIEIKNRKSKIYDPLPVYDYIQVQSYMQMLKVPNATVIQCLSDQTGKTITKEKNIKRDDKFWELDVLPKLKNFIKLLHTFISDTVLQDTFFQKPDNQKTRFYTSLLKKVTSNKSSTTKKPKSTTKPAVTKSSEKNSKRSSSETKSSSESSMSMQLKKQKMDNGTSSNVFIPPKICFFNDDEVDDNVPVSFDRPLFHPFPTDWLNLIGGTIPRKNDIERFVDNEYKSVLVYPPRHLIFTIFEKCRVKDVKVVIIGMDPYINPNEAMGMAFSVPKGIKFPPSLKNIFNEVIEDVGGTIPTHGDLTKWAEQGVLLMNCILTVRAKKTNSHKDCGWKELTDKIICKLSETQPHLVFLLWGSTAQEKELLIDSKKHTILKCAHPSPLSYTKGFKGCKHFSKTNQDLLKHNMKPIEWS